MSQSYQFISETFYMSVPNKTVYLGDHPFSSHDDLSLFLGPSSPPSTNFPSITSQPDIVKLRHENSVFPSGLPSTHPFP